MPIAIGAAFLGGLISFLSPCVLPIIPGFLAYLAGSTKDSEAPRRDVFFSSVFFVIGFSFVFALLGVLLNTVLGSVAYGVQLWLSRIGGIIIIIFGLYLLELIRIPFLERDYKFNVKIGKHSKYVTSFLFGLAFAAGWTPCVGPALAAILGLAASQPGSAFVLLFSYALGLGIPFMIVGLFTAQASSIIAKYSRAFRIMSMVFGAILILLGILVFTESLSRIASFDFLNNLLIRP